jgi:AcrR family transcriptional regulator
MSRTYTLRKRAAQQADTRRRIVEAAIDLHGSVGPASTTFSMVAERAGIQRHTLYAHFPDERSLSLACSGLHYERQPLPDAAGWRDIADPRQRIMIGLRAIYDWYDRNEMLVACVLRDAAVHPLTQEIVELRFVPFAVAWNEVLGEALNAKQRAMLHLALSFHTWRTLARESGMTQGDAVGAMVRAIEGAKQA